MKNTDVLNALATAFSENTRGMECPITFTIVDKNQKVARVVLVDDCGCSETEEATSVSQAS